MAIVELSVIPIGTNTTSVSKYVAEIYDVLEKEKGVKYQLNPMGTVIEGRLDDLMRIVRELHEVPFKSGVRRVYTVVKIDDRRDKESHMEDKIRSVNEKRKKISVEKTVF
ncbi:MAG: MTH1187 family thiamine-binding protein [Firmicutes bacterium]|nr:MTH1187 family thiamine-binding protein [Bacillota bacterium]